MPAYVTSPFKPSPALLMAGIPYYVLGSFDDRSSPTQGLVISDSAVTVTATLIFRILSGNSPAVGDLITVAGTANGGGNLNVTNVAIATVSTTQEGICTVTYAISSTTFGSTPDFGQVIVPRPEVGEVLQNGASVPVSVPSSQLLANQSKTVNATVSFSGAPVSATAYLQGAIFDKDSEYETLGIIANAGSPTSGPTLEVADSAYRFYRILVANVVGGASPKIIGKITC
jgi:hypothetical protein